MNTLRPSGTLFHRRVRDGAASGCGQSSILAGLICLPAGLAVERPYPSLVCCGPASTELLIDPSQHFSLNVAGDTEGYALSHLVTSETWRRSVDPRVCQTLLQDADLGELAGGYSYYIALSVIAQAVDLPDSCLVDMQEGVATAPRLLIDTTGMQIDQVLRLPFLIAERGERLALRFTTGPSFAASLADAYRAAIPQQERAPSDVEAIARAMKTLDGRQVIATITSDPTYAKYLRERQSSLSMSGQMLLTSSQCEANEAEARRALLAALGGGTTRPNPKPVKLGMGGPA